MAGTVQLTCNALSCNLSTSFNIRSSTSRRLGFCRAKIRAESQAVGVDQAEEPPSVAFAFVSSVLLPDGTPDVHFRKACGGQKLRNIMLDSNIDLYGPYARPLLNCAGGGTCGTCMVEIIQGEELLSPRTDKEKEKLTKKKRKNWRLACQTTVGKPDSRGLVVVQQLPEWKGHEWDYEKISPSEFQSELELEFGSESS
ncbi:photosynthetic NDH subunit of subcomplex B 3, chloroplastic isoform X1 [Alnus glutinosa]|uniref:photosynthetic NDH subunit of subcomplex B 3, chloroplastic isoform X1 n=1 Tax=Alnus glutinosa TaxID=3517 RepID=UPI002D794CF7|nr:photosynthetic NDH subunit of subcomplex B 3, chloroplastic isoform X1 [Alnus glutinosa]